MSRDVTLRSTDSDLVGDETYELWLKRASDAWLLYSTGDVAVDGSFQQEFVLLALDNDTDYVAQLRFQRAGRYRVGWLTENPDTWPSSSRIEFTTGALSGVVAPVLNSAVWSRTSALHTKVELSINASDLTKDLKVFRDGVAIHTIAAPHVNPVIYDDVDPVIAETHAYTAKHTVGFLDSAPSNEIDVFTGPAPVADFIETSLVTHYGEYSVSWTDDGRHYRLEDDYLCVNGPYTLVTGDASIFGSGAETVQKEATLIPPGATQDVAFHARIRATVTSFGVDDVSDWSVTDIGMEIDDPDDDTNFDTCP